LKKSLPYLLLEDHTTGYAELPHSARLRSNIDLLCDLYCVYFFPTVVTVSILPLFDADRLLDPAPIHTLGSAGSSLLDHNARGGEPLDCGIVKAVLAQ
jgi:hypothetical protein